jgi:hypothetical protein
METGHYDVINFFSFEVIACDDNKNNGKGGRTL